ncbi:MazF family toxin-antitoxin system protein [Bacillus phage SWEP1]|nr:MazF family toxin-antitoxin system protein [Bacillus phage SWEP1]
MEKPIMKEILRKAIESPVFSKEVLPVVPMSIFENLEIYKEITQVVRRYYQANSSVITEGALITLLEAKLDRLKKSADEQQQYFNKVNELYQVRDSHDDSLIDEEIEKYIKKQMRLELLKKAALKINDEAFQDTLEDEFRKIMLLDISGRNDEIINVIDDAEYKRIALSSLDGNTVPTGFKSIDLLNSGGLAKGELGLIAAMSGTGKTLMMTNLATNYVKQGYNVLFIALEELKNRMVLKLEQSMLRQTRGDILDGSTLNMEKFEKRQSFYKRNRDRFGNLFLARYSPRKVTPAKIEQLISDLLIRQGVKIDVVIVDYPELLRNPHATGNEADDGGKLFEEMRRIGQDFDVVMWTASQLNRTAYNALIRTSEHMEGSLRKKNAAELVLVVNQTPEEYNAGFLRLYADKVRNPPEGAYDKMLGFKVIGNQQVVREYIKGSSEESEHRAILEAVEQARDNMFKAKKAGGNSGKVPMPDFSQEINQAIRGGQ